ncbi:ABC transporter (ISS) isoform A [Haematococcus lacustris]|uniref:ABC transporter (ISS) isoform A n=1 Tax=Haematococcus lacustris TaxID=44745 RepID=A0A699YQJ4_HAELA|nr:ABC transporter (ISS) isoform A [Haematococcus lacustris]
MNAMWQARHGLPPDLFPEGIPVYSGHYHLPHTVPGTTIMYVGSQYQVNHGEAGERKRLLVLDAEQGWRVVEEGL